jgi:acyl carrier protein
MGPLLESWRIRMEKNENRNVKGDVSEGENDNLRITQDLGFESIDVVDLLFEVEQLSGIMITFGDLNIYIKARTGGRFQNLTVKDLIDYLNAQSK